MVTRNYDNMKNYQLFKKMDSSVGSEKGIYIRKITGELFSGLPDAGTPYTSWSNAYYTNFSFNQASGSILWIGGNSEQNAQCGGMSQLVENYDDYNLFHPFRGGEDENTVDAEVIAQKTKIGEPFFDEQDHSWKIEILREFKNVSGRTLEIQELGIFYAYDSSWMLIAREIFRNGETKLPESIIVEDECYFKVGYTVNCKDLYPNENMRRIRKWGNSTNYQSGGSTMWQDDYGDKINKSYIGKNKTRFFFIMGNADENRGSSITSNMGINILGWRKKGENHLKLDEKGNLDTNLPFNTSFKEIIGYQSSIEANKEISFGVYTNETNSRQGYLYNYSIEIDTDCLENDNPFEILDCFNYSGNEEIQVSKDINEKNILWLFRAKDASSLSHIGPVDKFFGCDSIYTHTVPTPGHSSYGGYTTAEQGTIFVDCSNKTSHTFSLSGQTEYIVYKIQVNTKIDPATGQPIPLYYDINLESDA